VAGIAYTAIEKGSGYVYAAENQLYHRVRTAGQVKYLKCSNVGCDGSAMLVGDQFLLLVGLCNALCAIWFGLCDYFFSQTLR